MNSVTHERIADLDLICKWAPNRAGANIVLCHGYGADANDLLSLSEGFDIGQDINWIFPHAPLAIDPSIMPYGRSWFPISKELLMESFAVGQPLDMTKMNPAGMQDAGKLLADMLLTLGLDLGSTIIGGFSQGAVIATHTCLNSSIPFRALAIFSGTLVNKCAWSEQAQRCQDLAFFQSHGRLDPLLSYDNACRLEVLLREAGLQGNLISFDGAHEIPLQVTTSFKTFCKSHFEV